MSSFGVFLFVFVLTVIVVYVGVFLSELKYGRPYLTAKNGAEWVYPADITAKTVKDTIEQSYDEALINDYLARYWD